MSHNQARIELFVDVFEQAGQRALALADLKPSQFIKAILQEFHSLEHLGDSADGYTLVKAENGEELADEVALSEQVQKGDRLVLIEREMPLPEGTRRPSLPIYLRESHEAKTYPVQWLPCIIGRRSEHQPYDALVAVDLRAYATGLRVSRRHLRVTEQNGSFYIENLSSNPASLLSQRQPGAAAITAQRQLLAPGDVIRLDRSDIDFKFITRPPAPAPEAEAPTTAPSDL